MRVESVVYIRSSQDTLRASQDTFRASSALPYRGFPSKAAYLQALRQFADSKMYFETDSQLVGFYGTKTTEEILEEEGGWRSKTKAQRQAEKDRKKGGVERARTSLATVPEDSGHVADDKIQVRGMRRFSRGIG
ncbi:hypothetical protein FKW77_005140 [Venturia effusa]|uniref:Uncharacterized protein n=1 Tax=Venturia effusa TaxID=50376 RepID=A0A517L5G6_9PEZI|nr:hypothetical protein FKW77_005140 [Venturia effusa]